jgi:hypothetical protein
MPNNQHTVLRGGGNHICWPQGTWAPATLQQGLFKKLSGQLWQGKYQLLARMSTRGQLSQASTPYGGSGGKGYYDGKSSPTPSGPGGYTPDCRDGCTQTAHSGISYWPPLFTRSQMRSRCAKPSRLQLFTTAPSPLLPGATVDGRVEYLGKTPQTEHGARRRPR